MIYFIQHGKDGPIKIGNTSSNNPTGLVDRLISLQVGNPVKLRIIGFCQGGKKEEILLHKQMRRFRISGEWFELKDELIDLIKNLSISNEKDRLLWDETISVDELVIKFQNEVNCNIYYKKLANLISGDKKIPSYSVFGRKRYKYENCKEYLKHLYEIR